MHASKKFLEPIPCPDSIICRLKDIEKRKKQVNLDDDKKVVFPFQKYFWALRQKNREIDNVHY